MSENDYYLTLEADEIGGLLIAIMTAGHPQDGDCNARVLATTNVKSEHEGLRWFEKMKREAPWEIDR